MSEAKRRGRKRNTDSKASKISIKKYFSSTLRSKVNTTHEATNILHLNIEEEDVQLNYSETKEIISNDVIEKHECVLSDFLEEWKNHTDVSCWNCCNQFDSVPIGYPVNFRDKKFVLKGIFCGFPCMLRYTVDRDLFKCNKYHIVNMYKVLTGENLTQNTIAPYVSTLDMFGGSMNVEEYRNVHKVKMFKYIRYPMHISRDYVEEIDLYNIKQANDYVFKHKQVKTTKANIRDFLN